MKICRRCMEEKEGNDFYSTTKNRDGLSSYCRKCFRSLMMEWRRKYPGRRTAHILVARALKNGKLKKADKCEICLRLITVVAHHDDYRKALKVRWLCDSCHLKLHRKNGLKGGRPKKAVLPAVIETNPK